jgi:hypothetical protein
VRQLTLDGYRAARLAALAYADGFAHGADRERAGRHDVRNAAASHDWQRGFEAGRVAVADAEQAYREIQLGGGRRGTGNP